MDQQHDAREMSWEFGIASGCRRCATRWSTSLRAPCSQLGGKQTKRKGTGHRNDLWHSYYSSSSKQFGRTSSEKIYKQKPAIINSAPLASPGPTYHFASEHIGQRSTLGSKPSSSSVLEHMEPPISTPRMQNSTFQTPTVRQYYSIEPD